MICLWCKLEKPSNEFSGKSKHCKICHNHKYKNSNRERKRIKVICPNCHNERLVREDAYKKSKSDMCIKCSPLFNKQLFKATHNLDINHPLYRRWNGMKARCKTDAKKKYYKDKGIIVCDEWQDYTTFYNWAMNNGFREDLEIDRIDENKNYCPENCQWITHKENTLKIKNLFGRDL